MLKNMIKTQLLYFGLLAVILFLWECHFVHSASLVIRMVYPFLKLSKLVALKQLNMP